MVEITFENVSSDTGDTIKSESIKLADLILKDNIPALKEIILTSDMYKTLESRMLEEDFSFWSGRLGLRGGFPHGKTFRVVREESVFSIALLTSEHVQTYLFSVLTHELWHVLMNIQMDDYLTSKKFDAKTLKKIWNTHHTAAEHEAYRIERVFNLECEHEPDLPTDDLNEVITRFVKRYKELCLLNQNDFDEGIEVALADMSSILLCISGFHDAEDKLDELKDKLLSGLAHDLFEDSLYLMIKAILDYWKNEQRDILELSQELDVIGDKQRAAINRNINKVIVKYEI